MVGFLDIPDEEKNEENRITPLKACAVKESNLKG